MIDDYAAKDMKKKSKFKKLDMHEYILYLISVRLRVK